MSEGYILNALQTPAVLRPVYESVRSGNVTKDAIKEDTRLGKNLLEQGLNGLQLVRLLGRDEGKYYVIDPPWELDDDDLAFRMAILHNLADECTPNDWGKQAVVLLNYQYLLQEDIQYFENDDEVLYDEINAWQRREKNYVPQSKQGEIDLNKPKFVNWSRQVEYLGLVHKARGREHLVYPDPDMVEASIEIAVEEAGADGRIGIRQYLGWLRENLLQVETTDEGAVPTALARILYNHVRDGAIRLTEYGDAGAIKLDRTPRRDGIDKEANTIELEARI
jgi:hypothetical protein